MTADGLDAYGECRDSERTKFSNLSAGVIAKKKKEEKSQMKQYLRDHSNSNLLPSGEIKEAEPITEDKIQKNKAA